MPTLTGGPDNDLIIGTDDIDTISGLAGNDELRGMDGADIIDGGSGDDLITGGLGADVMTGGTGVDRFRDTVAGLNGDRITDFLPGDRIQITDLTPQNANIGINGSAITFNGGSVTIDNLGPGRLIVRAIQTGGVEVRLQQIAKSDFNGDGKSDVLWRNDNGWFTSWTANVNGNGGFASNDANHFNAIPVQWQVVGTGDFNGEAATTSCGAIPTARSPTGCRPGERRASSAMTPTPGHSRADQLERRRRRRLQRRRARRHPVAQRQRADHQLARPGQRRLRQQ